ncbi:probable ADP-ribosylation factor GTPase-activating protein agd14 [Phtheirospermum japonicum]|uniref:Probable ADP-ribosylation factor GTPase-activating protein agd14 n=1 Tax=Phtheirospermum japonicum TaxID=374723 RepID=A0A830D1E3_9LAMI|nr:probable ADP-ribosylation factor GTPase-activating protein agd14 [Phtheirospermum japonicum]
MPALLSLGRREEEKNEKIIRGLMKLPPNRRCINCNSLGPQYVCTNFWTFVCPICSGIHREFTHRVKSVSMAKFTSQEVDALQKGGNQRARELFLITWDSQKQMLPDNSNVDKVREFIKNVYVEKIYALEKSSNRPPRDSQNHVVETRRASSYHSYSQSPPYDFQYEERRYGKAVPSLTRKPGSDRGLYEEKIFSFLSPSRLSGANDGSYPRASDYSVSSGGDPFRSDVLSPPSSQREIGSPFSDTSSYFSSDTGHHNVNNGGRIWRPQRSESSGSFGSFDSVSFKSVNSLGLQEISSKPEQSSDTFHNKTSSFPSQPQSSIPTTFNGSDLFSKSIAPQNVTSTPMTRNSHPPELPLAQSVDLFQHSPIPSAATVSEQTNYGGWATFDVPQNLVPVGTEKSNPAAVTYSDGNNVGNRNPFSLDQSSSNQNPVYHEPSASMQALWHDGVQNVETTTNNSPLWNAFEDYPRKQPVEDVTKNNDRAAVLHASDANKPRGFGVYKTLGNKGNVKTPGEIEPPSLSFSNFSMVTHDFSTAPVMAGVHSLATEHKPTNPFDLPCDAVLESSNMTPFWDMSSLPAPYVGDANESWFLQNSVASYAPGVATFDSPSGSLGFIVGQVPINQISTVSQGPIASVGGNPFA